MFKIITIPFDRIKKGFDEDLLNRFILNKQVKSLQAEFFEDKEDKYWTIFLEYDPILQEEVAQELKNLDKPQSTLLLRLKEWRKERAEKDGIPVYIICTNKQLIDIVRSAPKSLEALKLIKGFGQRQYGRRLFSCLIMKNKMGGCS